VTGLVDLLGPDGPLAHHLPGFVPRAPQQQMAVAVAAAVEAEDTLVVEAGTGTGKTFAYLVPALMSGKRVVISTGTKNLQDQLYTRDLPRVREALGVPVRTALLKGRANYLCLYRMKRAAGQPAARPWLERLREVDAWSRATTSGEIAELGRLADDEALARQITSTADNCLGSKCADFNQCFVAKARRQAQAAELVVVNHHLLFADFVLKEEGFGQILAGVEAVVLDEAHQLPELAASFFGLRVSTRQLRELARDVVAETESLGDMDGVKESAEALAASCAPLEAAFASLNNRLLLSEFLERGMTQRLVEDSRAALDELATQLKPFEERNAELAACVERTLGLETRWRQILEPSAEERVCWVEPAQRGGSFHATPIAVAEGFARMRGTYPGSWVLTSATLAAGRSFQHFCGQMGLDADSALQLDSPFDYREQARLYLPPGLPDPNAADYSQAVAEAAVPVIEASGGGAFVLCTSHRALQRIAERLRARLQLRVFVQGDDDRNSLLQAFSADGNGVLVGTSSFWEGVDVKGRSLRVVIIDRIPFAAPGDPVFEARLDTIRRRGGSPFGEHQLPQAIMTLRQGVGRLIRDPSDRGLLMLCDPRLRGKSYGRQILASLPQMPVLTAVDEAQAWVRTL
jgi:ATP-dependent DNA helicase DinG